MTVKIGDVFICTSTNENYQDFELFKSYAVQSVDDDITRLKGVKRTGGLLKERDYYVFGKCELEATFERPKPPF